MFRPVAFAVALVGLCWVTASAQTPNPVVQHYRAYQAAFDANDLVTAEREATAALAASEARDGDGGSTAVLALNLATVRFLNNNAAGALEPGRRALTLAHTMGEEATGVSPVLAQLLVSRAELAAGVTGAAEQLAFALDAAQQARIDPAEIFDAAVELGAWTFQRERWSASHEAWSIAVEYAEGSRFGADFGGATALTGQAAALMLEDLGGNTRARFSEDAAREVFLMLRQALSVLRPLAELNSDGETTRAQRTYAQALAWRAILWGKLQSDNQAIPEMAEAQGDADGLSEVDIPPAAAPQPRCLVRFTPRSAVRLFPEGTIEDGQLAGMAVRFRIGESGQVESVETLALVGPDEFRRTVERPAAWRVQRLEESPPNCRMAMNVIQSIAFSIN